MRSFKMFGKSPKVGKGWAVRARQCMMLNRHLQNGNEWLSSCPHHSLPNDGVLVGKRDMLLGAVFGISEGFLVKGMLGPPKACYLMVP